MRTHVRPMHESKAEVVYSEHFEKSIHEAVEPLLTGMGISLVELSTARMKGTTRVAVVIYRKEGVGVDDCAEVSRLLLPRLQTIEGLRDVSLEVSSPGIERTIRHQREYELFRGRGARILAGADTEWFGGIIDRVEGGTLWLRKGKERRGFALEDIRKARLDYTVEVEEAKNAV
jgi:ribosome maturation factor RimP